MCFPLGEDGMSPNDALRPGIENDLQLLSWQTTLQLHSEILDPGASFVNHCARFDTAVMYVRELCANENAAKMQNFEDVVGNALTKR
jgi:hypothetical protein